MVEQFNEFAEGLITPIEYMTVSGTGKPKPTDCPQNVASASLPKDKTQNATEGT